MPASITRLVARLGSFDEAVVAFRAARFRNCLSQLHGNETNAARFVFARAALRLGEPEAARTAVEGDVGSENRDRAEAALLRAVAELRLGNTEFARSGLTDAFAYSVSAADLALEVEVRYYEGLIALGDGDLRGAREACELGINVASSPHPSNRISGIAPLGHAVSRTQELLGIVCAADGRYQEFIEHARSALATFDRSGTPDVFAEAFALRNLAVLARDFDIERDASMLASRVPALAWTKDVSRVEFTTVEALGWCSGLRGDSVGALRLFRRAASAATTDPERIIIGVDRALLAREAGHRAMVTEEVEYALDLARGCDWERAAGDSRDALLVLAQVAAPLARIRAREMLDRYTSIRNAMDASYIARIEPRARAEEAYTHGLVLRAEGRPTASIERLRVAFEIWETIGFDWRAARAALELAELDGGDVFRLAVRRELVRRPDSFFSGRARLVA